MLELTDRGTNPPFAHAAIANARTFGVAVQGKSLKRSFRRVDFDPRQDHFMRVFRQFKLDRAFGLALDNR